MKRFYHQSEIKFECQPDCANCCKLSNGFVFLTEKEALKIAENLAISEDEFLQYFTRIIDDQICLVNGEDEHCVFLENHKCNIYEVKPLQCRTYPFWPENLKSKSRWQLTCNECPGVGKGRVYSVEEIEKILKT
ncbi:MAG: YkgJ family cysteine cluster protein [Calditrichaceae bacterium]|nr:YkgJ family cysteine cluster protein [Calditrichaceae bacterium]